MRVSILAAAAAITLSACQPAAEPQPVDAQTVPDVPAAAFSRPMMDYFVPSAEKIEAAMMELARY